MFFLVSRLRPAGLGGEADPGGKTPKNDASPIAVIEHELVMWPLRAQTRNQIHQVPRREAAIEISDRTQAGRLNP
jgi:hypothetical protein